MCLSIILLLFSNIDFFVPPFVVEISLSLVGTGTNSASCHQFLHQLLVITGGETGGNWRRNWWQLAEIAGAVTGANWRSWHQLKSPYKSTRILDLISKKSYGKWKYEWYLSFHSEISTECHHIPLGINDFKTEIFWSEIDDLCSKISWMRGVGWSDEKNISDLDQKSIRSNRCRRISESELIWRNELEN